MTSGIPNIPSPRNEPVLAYAPGSVERAALRTRLADMSSNVIEIMPRIDGTSVPTGRSAEAVMPHDHGHVLAVWHQAGKQEIARAIDAAVTAHRDWFRVNKLRGSLRCVAVKAPAYGDRRRDILEDIAVPTADKVVTDALGIRLEDLALADLGRASRAVVGRETTTIIGGAGEKGAIESRKHDLRAQIDRATSDWDREKLQERLAKLAGGVAVIRVGAPSEAEMKSKKEALDDAISATRAAVAEGIVPGGGLALLRTIAAIESEEATAEGDERIGLAILRRALEAPTRQIAENSAVDGGVVVERMRAGTNGFGFDAARKRYVDLVETGIVDPTKVVRVALENAVSVASVLPLTEATLTEVPKKDADEHEAAHE